MKIYIDLFFLLNIIMDAIVITSVSILLKRRTTTPRIVVSSIIGGIISLLLFTSLNKILIEVTSVLIMVLIAFKYVDIRYTLKNIFYMYTTGIFLAGFIYLINVNLIPTINNYLLNVIILIIISPIITVIYIKSIKKRNQIF